MPGGDATQIYVDLMRFKPDGLTPNAWAMKAGVSRTVWSDMRRHGNPSRRTLERLLIAAGSSLAEFEALRVGDVTMAGTRTQALADRGISWAGRQTPPLPLIASAIGGAWGGPPASAELTFLYPEKIIERVFRPASLAEDASAYAFTIVGNGMWPRFRPGRRVAVSSQAPAAIGDDVLVKLSRESSGTTSGDASVPVLIGELVSRSGNGVELRQFNPAKTFATDGGDVAAIEKILGELI